MRAMVIVFPLLALGLGGCSQYESRAQPVSSVGASPNAQEPANSLPRGSAVNAPVLRPGTGLNTTRVP